MVRRMLESKADEELVGSQIMDEQGIQARRNM